MAGLGSHKKLPSCISKRVGKLSHFISSYTVDRFGLFSSTVGLIPRRHRRLNRPPRGCGSSSRWWVPPGRAPAHLELGTWLSVMATTLSRHKGSEMPSSIPATCAGFRRWGSKSQVGNQHVREHVSPILRVHAVRHVAVTKVEKF